MKALEYIISKKAITNLGDILLYAAGKESVTQADRLLFSCHG